MVYREVAYILHLVSTALSSIHPTYFLTCIVACLHIIHEIKKTLHDLDKHQWRSPELGGSKVLEHPSLLHETMM